VTVEEIESARQIVPIVSVQNRCNPSDLSAFETGVVEYCTLNEIAMIPYSPVGGRFGKGLVEENVALQQVAEIYHIHVFQVALAWLLAKSPMMIPIPGATRIQSVESSAAVMDIQFDAAHVQQLDTAFGI
jgi:aryl-alcohol dehydrogenase-like predicted oxidoreductase